MAATTGRLDRAAVVARLRAAGCVFAEQEADLLLTSAGSPAELMSMMDLRAAGHPLEHIVGWARFCGLRITVTPGVFVPRPRTQLLARRAATLAARSGALVVDLCCGTGAIGAAVAALATNEIQLYATDIDPVAVACARRNLASCRGRVHQGDLLTALPERLRGRIDVLVANVPYVPSDAIDMLAPEARLHEPRQALDGGADGLDVLRRLAAPAPDWLAPGGHLLVETSQQQAPTAAGILDRAGLGSHLVRDHELDATVVIARR